MIYILIIILLFTLSYYYDYKKHKGFRNFWYVILLLTFILVGGLRFRLGTDTVTYQEDFKLIPTLSQISSYNFSNLRYGIGYLFLAITCKSICNSFVFLQIIQSIIVNSIIFIFFYKNTKNIFTGLLLYFLLAYFYFIFEIMRESIAVGIFLISLKYLIKKHIFKYYICILIAITFHISASFLILLPLLFYSPINRFFQFGKLFWLSVIILIISGHIFFNNFFSYLGYINIAQLQDSVNTYSQSEYYGGSRELYTSRILAYIVKIILYPFLIIYIIKNKEINLKIKKDEFNIYESIICLYIYVMIASINIVILARFSNYFSLIIILLISEIMYQKILFYKRRLSISFICWFIILIPYISPLIYGYLRYQPETNFRTIRIYYPYVSYIDPYIDNEREIFYSFIGKI